MADINDVLERLITDPGFRKALGEDSERALEGYELTDADREMLAAQISEDAGTGGGVEQRTSKSALAGLVGGSGLGQTSQSDYEFITERAKPENIPTEEVSLNYAEVERDSADADGSGATSHKPKEIVVVPSKPPSHDEGLTEKSFTFGKTEGQEEPPGDVSLEGDDASDPGQPIVTGRLYNDHDPGEVETKEDGAVSMTAIALAESGAEIQDGTSNTMMVGESTETAEGKAGGDVVIKGRKILENAEEDPSLVTPEPEPEEAVDMFLKLDGIDGESVDGSAVEDVAPKPVADADEPNEAEAHDDVTLKRGHLNED